MARLAADERTRLHDTLMADLKQYERDGVIKLPSEAIYVTAVR